MVVGATIEAAAADDMITRASQCEDRLNLRCVTAASRQRPHASFQRRNALLQHVVGGVHDACIDIAKLA